MVWLACTLQSLHHQAFDLTVWEWSLNSLLLKQWFDHVMLDDVIIPSCQGSSTTAQIHEAVQGFWATSKWIQALTGFHWSFGIRFGIIGFGVRFSMISPSIRFGSWNLLWQHHPPPTSVPPSWILVRPNLFARVLEEVLNPLSGSPWTIPEVTSWEVKVGSEKSTLSNSSITGNVCTNQLVALL